MPSMTLQEFETKIKGANGLLVVVDFTTIGGAQSLDSSFFQLNKHRIFHVKVPFQPKGEVCIKFGIESAPSLITLTEG